MDTLIERAQNKVKQKTKDERGRREKAPKNKAVDDEDWEKYGTSEPGSETNRRS